MSDEVILGQMTCPNCGNIVSTIPYINCICGYNFQTGKVEESPLAEAIKDIEIEELNLEPLDQLLSINKILDSITNKRFIDIFKKEYTDANN